jgi:hypothetical protein
VSGPVVQPHRNLSLLLDHLAHKLKLLHTEILTTNNSRLAMLNNSDQTDFGFSAHLSNMQLTKVEWRIAVLGCLAASICHLPAGFQKARGKSSYLNRISMNN